MREPLRNIIVHVLHDCRDGGIFSRGQDKGNIHAFFSPFVENGNCFKRVVGVIERFMVGPSKAPLQASMNRKTVSTPGAKSARHIKLCGHKLFKLKTMTLILMKYKIKRRHGKNDS